MKQRSILFVALSFAVLAIVVQSTSTVRAADKAKSSPSAKSDTFKAMVPVVRHPRCMNCHSPGDYPRQGDDGHRHAMGVRRGEDGEGVTAERCSTCHQDHNLGAHQPPGAPNWGLPPAATPMIWQGKSDGEICRLMKDPKQNGGRDINKLVEHLTEDKLVAWGWNPGPGRNPVPISHDEFSRRVKAWQAAGAPCPE